MATSVLDVPEQVLGRPYRELSLLDTVEWGDYLPLVHPVSLRVITVVRRGRNSLPEPWTCADVREGKLVNVGHPAAKDVAVFKDALKRNLAASGQTKNELG